MENMDDILQKAQVLVEALPYIQRFNRKIIVVKYGGSTVKACRIQADHRARRRQGDQQVGGKSRHGAAFHQRPACHG